LVQSILRVFGSKQRHDDVSSRVELLEERLAKVNNNIGGKAMPLNVGKVIDDIIVVNLYNSSIEPAHNGDGSIWDVPTSLRSMSPGAARATAAK
jgi:hypothetical protein